MIDRLIPACKDYLWGGTRLKEEYGKQCDTAVLAETWELSCHPDGPSRLECAGISLPEYLAAHPECAGPAAARFSEFPLLVKLIDAERDLSIQVHPDDAYAQEHEHQNGKTEMWYVVDCAPGASLCYGFRQTLSRAEFEQAIRENALTDRLRRVEVHPGDVFFVKAGTVHAIGAGCLIAEIQQSSNVTYRVSDYGRLGADGKPRPLHIRQALEVSTLAPAPSDLDFGGHLGKCRAFTVDRRRCAGSLSLPADGNSFHGLLFLEGSAQVSCPGRTLEAKKGQCLFVDAGTACRLSGNCALLDIYVEPPVCRIGIDLGGTAIKAGVVDRENRIIAQVQRPTLARRPWREIAEDMTLAAREAVSAAGLTMEDIASVGVGSPGIVNAAAGTVVYANNLPGWEQVPLAETLQTMLHLPVRISNDANCAALGEALAGAARGASSALLLTLGTGVGGGVVYNGRIFDTGPGSVEIGHTSLCAGGALCTCGRRGCLEAYCSATALIRFSAEAAKAHPDSLLNTLCGGDLSKMDGRIPFEAAKQGDAAAQAVVNAYLTHLGEGVTNLVNLFRPEVVLLSGGICGQGETLTAPVERFLRQNAFGRERLPLPPVRIAALGNAAGLVGAANL